MSYKLVEEKEHGFKIQHPDGSHFPVLKAGLPKEALAKIKALKMADGGEVPETQVQTDPSQINIPDNIPQIDQNGHDQSQNNISSQSQVWDQPYGTGDTYYGTNQPVKEISNELKKENEPVDMSWAKDMRDPASVDSNSSQDMGTTSAPISDVAQKDIPLSTSKAPEEKQPEDYITHFENQYKAGAEAIAGAKQKEADSNAKLLDDLARSNQEWDTKHQQVVTGLEKELQQNALDYKNGKIDPNRYMHNMSTGSRIATAISLMLGGIGAGLTKGPNYAAEILNKQIDRDIEGQKMDLGKAENLYSMNLKRLGNEDAAYSATKLQMLNSAKVRLEVNASRSQSAQAMPNFQMGMAALEEKMLPEKIKLHDMIMKSKAMGAGGGEAGVPIGKEPMTWVNDKDYMGRRVQVDERGKVYTAGTPKDAEDLRNMQGLYQPIVEDINHLKKLGPSAAIPGTSENKLAQGIMGRLAMSVNEFNGYKRFTDVDAETIGKQFASNKSIADLMSGNERNVDALHALRTKLESERAAKIPNYPKNTFQTKAGW